METIAVQGLNQLLSIVSGSVPHDPVVWAMLGGTVMVWIAHFALRRQISREAVRVKQDSPQERRHTAR